MTSFWLAWIYGTVFTHKSTRLQCCLLREILDKYGKYRYCCTFWPLSAACTNFPGIYRNLFEFWCLDRLLGDFSSLHWLLRDKTNRYKQAAYSDYAPNGFTHSRIFPRILRIYWNSSSIGGEKRWMNQWTWGCGPTQAWHVRVLAHKTCGSGPSQAWHERVLFRSSTCTWSNLDSSGQWNM